MKLEEIIALKSQIFTQIVEGPIPKEAIEELFGGLLDIVLDQGIEYIDFRSAAWEAKADEVSNVIDFEMYRRERAKYDMYSGDDEDGDQ